MADVNIQQSPDRTGGGSGGAVGWFVAVLILLAVVAFLVFGGGLNQTVTHRAEVKISTPSTPNSSGGDVVPKRDTGR